ncbi:MAG TPA: FAD-linked oxidase C-terminal domain-containing protein [Armatimonadota bacterium]|jgi:glycolate oxidase subunit GlcD
MNPEFLRRLKALLSSDAVLTQPVERMVYECDAYTVEKAQPDVVTLPSSTDDVAGIVRLCREYAVPFLARGAGTGLSGGALALGGTVIIAMARMNKVLSVDAANRRARVQAGIVNTHVSRAVEAFGLHFAPDPSSQSASTIGGNIAENAGGPHTLKYGVTSNHILAAEIVTPDGDVIEVGSPVEDAPGLDLLGVIVGSEGTFGIITEATLRLTPIAPAWRTLLATFDTVDDATNTVSGIIAEGILPAALEMMDAVIIQSVEAAFHLGFPLDAAAVLLVELDGHAAGLDADAARCLAVCEAHHARKVDMARTEEERAALWKARKKGVGTLGRISRSMVTQDCVIPRSKLPVVLASISEIVARHGLRVANIFHAGDGNLHPIVLFDERIPDEVERMVAAGHEIISLCLGVGGSITGEHGVGVEKQDFLALQFSEADLDTMRRLHDALDPDDFCNPGKVFPGAKGCSRGCTHEIKLRQKAAAV